MEEQRLLNVKADWRLHTVEYLVKALDNSQDLSRLAIIQRATDIGVNVTDWLPAYNWLCGLKPESQAPAFATYQVRSDPETARRLEIIRSSMFSSLKKAGLISSRLQTQYMLKLLLINYLLYLQRGKIEVRSDDITENDMTIPELAATFAELILTEKDGDTMAALKKILVDWKNSR